MPPRVTVITVNYHSRDLIAKLASSLNAGQFTDFEFIVIDNDRHNIGYGSAVNQAAAQAKGEYLLIINPDTQAFPTTLSSLVEFLDQHPDVGLAAPTLLDSASHPYPLQGTRRLTPLRAIFSLSFITRLLPHNRIYQDYYLQSQDRSRPYPVAVVPGTAFLIRTSLFHQLSGFDSRFFLYFEEFDLCARAQELGLKIYILPQSRLIHHWAKSTPNDDHIQRVFTASRFNYFKKHFGLVAALAVELFCRFNKNYFLFTLIFLWAAFLRLNRIGDLMPFFGDQGWFYLSARNALLFGQFPRLGITASATWLNQGPLFTYLLIPVLFLGQFAPVGGALLTIFFDLLALLLIFLYFGLPAALLYSSLPLVVFTSRIAYHTSLIPFFTVLLFAALARRKAFTSGLLLGFLYQLELATVIFWPVFALSLLRSKLSPIKVVFGLIIGLGPFLLFAPRQIPQFFKWIFLHLLSPHPLPALPNYFGYFQFISQFILPLLPVLAYLIFIFALIRRYRFSDLWFLIPVLGVLLMGIPSQSYLVILFIPLTLFIAKKLHPFVLVALLFCNSYYLLSTQYFRLTSYPSPKFSDLVAFSDQIQRQSSTSHPQLTIVSPFSSTVDPYLYLIWWRSLSRPPGGVHTRFQLQEHPLQFRVLE